MEPGSVGAVRDGQWGGGDCTMPGNISQKAAAGNIDQSEASVEVT